MHSHSLKTFDNVFEYLNKTTQSEFTTVTIDHKERLLHNNEIVHFDDQKNPLLPPSLADELNVILILLDLSKENDINTHSKKSLKKTALIQATILGQINLVRILLDHGADPGISDSDGNNALMHAA